MSLYSEPISVTYTPEGESVGKVLSEKWQPNLNTLMPGSASMTTYETGLLFRPWGFHASYGSMLISWSIAPLYGFDTPEALWTWRADMLNWLSENPVGKIEIAIGDETKYSYTASIREVEFDDPNPIPDFSDLGYTGKYWIALSIGMTLSNPEESTEHALSVTWAGSTVVDKWGGADIATGSIVSAYPWTAQADKEWASVSPELGGRGSGSTSVSIDGNPTGSTRTVKVTISDGELTETKTFTQTASSRTGTITANGTLPASSGTTTLTVKSDTNWTISKDYPYTNITVTPSSGEMSKEEQSVTVRKSSGSTPGLIQVYTLNLETDDGTIMDTVDIESTPTAVSSGITVKPSGNLFWNGSRVQFPSTSFFTGESILLIKSPTNSWSVVPPSSNSDDWLLTPSTGSESSDFQPVTVYPPATSTDLDVTLYARSASTSTGQVSIPARVIHRNVSGCEIMGQSSYTVMADTAGETLRNWVYMSSGTTRTSGAAWADLVADSLTTGQWFNDKVTVAALPAGTQGREVVIKYHPTSGDDLTLTIIQGVSEEAFSTTPASPITMQADIYSESFDVDATGTYYINSLPDGCMVFPTVGGGSGTQQGKIYVPPQVVSSQLQPRTVEIPFSLPQIGGATAKVQASSYDPEDMSWEPTIYNGSAASSGAIQLIDSFATPVWVDTKMEPVTDTLTVRIAKGVNNFPGPVSPGVLYINGQELSDSKPYLQVPWTGRMQQIDIMALGSSVMGLYLEFSSEPGYAFDTYSELQFDSEFGLDAIYPTQPIYYAKQGECVFAVKTNQPQQLSFGGVQVNLNGQNVTSTTNTGYNVYHLKPISGGAVPAQITCGSLSATIKQES